MMTEIKQLHMRKTGLEHLPPLSLKAGYGIHTHRPGDEPVWEDIIRRAFGCFYSFNDFLIPCGNYDPAFVHYVSKDGVDIATAMGTEKPDFPGEGWFRMVGAVPEAQGTGAGKLAALAVLHSLAARGYNSVVLSTDDFRLPAIGMYLSLGFEPILFDETHQARWQKVQAQLAEIRAKAQKG